MNEATKPIAILLTDRFADWEFGMLTGPGVGFYDRRVVWVSPTGDPVRSMGGLMAVPDLALYQLDADDMAALVLIGGDSWLGDSVPNVTQTVRAFHEAGVVVAAICGGTVGLARSGLLDDVDHTSNAANFLPERAPSYRGQDRYRAVSHAVRDGQIVTAPGPAPASFAAEILDAVGVPSEKVNDFRAMLRAEHVA